MYHIIMRLFFKLGEGETLDYATVETKSLPLDIMTKEALDAKAEEIRLQVAEQTDNAPELVVAVTEEEVEADRKARIAKHFMDKLFGGMFNSSSDEDETEDCDCCEDTDCPSHPSYGDTLN